MFDYFYNNLMLDNLKKCSKKRHSKYIDYMYHYIRGVQLTLMSAHERERERELYTPTLYDNAFVILEKTYAALLIELIVVVPSTIINRQSKKQIDCNILIESSNGNC
jgi:hypothetical protein